MNGLQVHRVWEVGTRLSDFTPCTASQNFFIDSVQSLSRIPMSFADEDLIEILKFMPRKDSQGYQKGAQENAAEKKNVL